MITVRPATSGDFPVLAQIYADGVRACGPSAYSLQQIAAWAVFAEDTSAFAGFITAAETVVATEGPHILGFSGLDADGRIASLYVAPAAMRRGVAGTLLAHVTLRAHARGMQEVWTQASHFSLPVFLRHGFTREQGETVIRNGVNFDRHILRRHLSGSPGTTLPAC